MGVTICIWKNPYTFEIIQKIGSHLEKYGHFKRFFHPRKNFPDAQKLSGHAKTFWTRKNFPDGNATLSPRFLGLWDGDDSDYGDYDDGDYGGDGDDSGYVENSC